MNLLDVYTGWNFDTPVNINSIYTQGWFNFNTEISTSTINTDIYTGWNFDTPVNINSIYTHGWFNFNTEISTSIINTDIYTGWNFDTPVNVNSIYTHGWFTASTDEFSQIISNGQGQLTLDNFNITGIGNINYNVYVGNGIMPLSNAIINGLGNTTIPSHVGNGNVECNIDINGLCSLMLPIYTANDNNIELSNIVVTGIGNINYNIYTGSGSVELDNILVEGLYDITIINVSASIPIISRVSNLIKVRTSMFDNYTSTFNGMSNNTNMPNGYLTKCGTLYNNERKVYSSMVTEMYNQHGVCLTYYIVTYDVNYNRIFGEDNNKRFERVFDVMGYYQLPREEKIWNKFGIEGADEVTIFISKKHFQDASTYGNNLVQGNIGINTYSNYIPKIGDIIKSNFNKYIYEVTEVKEESGMFLQSKQHVWEIIVRPYKFEHVNVTPSTSASLSDVLVYTSGAKDIFDTKTEVTEKVTEDIAYIPQSTEKANNDPFAGW